jgi:hypothetical protein
MKYNTTTLDIVIDEAFVDVGLEAEKTDLALLKRWATDIYRELSTPDQLIHKIVLLQVDRLGKVLLPDDYKLIDQISYRLVKSKEDCTKREQVVQWIQNMYDGCQAEVNFKCDVCHQESCSCAAPKIEVDVDYMWLKSNPWYTNPTTMGTPINSTDQLQNLSYLNNKFTLLAYKGNAYHRLRYHVDNCENLNCIGCSYGYSIELPYILTDLPKDTEVLISYFGEKTDENGDITIPDEPNTLEAIKKGILHRHFGIKMMQSSDNAVISKYRYFYEKFQAESDVAIGRAKSKLDQPSAQEWRSFLSKVWTKRVRNRAATNQAVPNDPYDNYLRTSEYVEHLSHPKRDRRVI